MSLPKITSGTVKSVVLEMESLGILHFTQGMIDRLNVENPLVIQWLNILGEQELTPQKLVYAGVMIYRLLEKQQEVDEITRKN